MLTLLRILVLTIFICFFSISVTTVLNPYFIWKINESWKAVRVPSREYFILYRIAGVIASILGLLFFIVFIKAVF